MKHKQGNGKSASLGKIDGVLSSPESKATGITPSKKKKEKKRITSVVDVSDEGLSNHATAQNDVTEIDMLGSPGSKATGITPSKKKKEKKRITSVVDVSDEGLSNHAAAAAQNDATEIDGELGSPESEAAIITQSKKKKEKKRITSIDVSDEGLGNPPAEIDEGLENPESKAIATSGRKKKNKKRTASVLEPSNEANYDTTSKEDAINQVDDPLHSEQVQENGTEYSIDEPTMEEKLASLNLLRDDKITNISTPEAIPSPMKPPSADSMHVLLKQALHAEDNALLLNCLQIKDEKVIVKSVSLLNPADAVKLLKSLLSLIESRGVILICVIAWLRSLLSQHTSNIMSQESSLLVLNSLYQLIESRVSTYESALQLSTFVDYLFDESSDDDDDKETDPPPIIYEDKDSDEEESEDAMDTDDEENEGLGDVIDASHDPDGDESDIMSD